jgi:aspartate-semialdehyde dehydrogenase
MKRYNVAVVGATGLVGTEMLNTLEKRRFPVKALRPLASEKSVGKKINFNKMSIAVGLLAKDSFDGVDIVLSSAGADISKRFLPYAVRSGAVCIDNTSAFRMDKGVPLVVPEVNPEDVFKHKGIIANPNCSTIQMVAALKPLHDYARIKRIVVSTYQAVSGAGNKGLNQLKKEIAIIGNKRSPRLLKGYRPGKFPYQIAYNLIPHIDVFLDNGYTKEEMKMINETRKILHNSSIRITATCVRVPVFVSHSESVNIETARPVSADKARRILSKSCGIKVIDNPPRLKYPMPVEAARSYETYVGRIRKDESIKNGLNLWIVSDNLLKGAALNAVQIAEVLIGKR